MGRAAQAMSRLASLRNARRGTAAHSPHAAAAVTKGKSCSRIGASQKERSGAPEERARENQREPEGDARARNVAEPGPENRRVRLLALPQRRLGTGEKVAVREQQREQRHLDPENPRARERLDVGEEQQEAARDRDHETQHDRTMDRVEVLEVADLPRDAGGHRDEGLTVSRDREAPAQEDARQMEKSEGSLDRGIVAVERRPRFEE